MIQYVKLCKNSFFNRFMQATLILLFVMLASSRLAFAGLPTQDNTVLKLDGLDDHGKMSEVKYGGIDGYTVELWFNTGQQSGDRVLFAATQANDSTKHGIFIQLNNSGKVRAVHRSNWGNNDGQQILYDPIGQENKDYRDGEWHHLVFSRVPESNSIRLFIDGSQKGTAANASKHDDFTATNDGGEQDDNIMDFFIGQLGQGNRYFDGEIDEVRFWSRRLSVTTIERNFDNPITLIGDESNLKGYWNFDLDNGDDLQLNGTTYNPIFGKYRKPCYD